MPRQKGPGALPEETGLEGSEASGKYQGGKALLDARSNPNEPAIVPGVLARRQAERSPWKT
jgi:hypothetical protein